MWLLFILPSCSPTFIKCFHPKKKERKFIIAFYRVLGYSYRHIKYSCDFVSIFNLGDFCCPRNWEEEIGNDVIASAIVIIQVWGFLLYLSWRKKKEWRSMCLLYVILLKSVFLPINDKAERSNNTWIPSSKTTPGFLWNIGNLFNGVLWWRWKSRQQNRRENQLIVIIVGKENGQNEIFHRHTQGLSEDWFEMKK